MFRKTKIALSAALVLGSASLALADGYTDLGDGMRNYGPVVQQPAHQAPLTTRNVSQTTPNHQGNFSVEKNWMDRASQNVDGGGN